MSGIDPSVATVVDCATNWRDEFAAAGCDLGIPSIGGPIDVC